MITYGRSIPSIADQLYGKRDDMTEEEKLKGAKHVYDSVIKAFPNLKKVMLSSQNFCRKHGFTETILGRRRHLPDMTLKEFEFLPMKGYVNPDIDPFDPNSIGEADKIPNRIVNALEKEFKSFKYFGQIVKRTNELKAEKIRVVNNRRKIGDATRQVLNCVDFDTEILTLKGWKAYHEVHEGDDILSYNLNSQKIELDNVLDVHITESNTEVYKFESPTFSAVCTSNHRWVVGQADGVPRIKLAENIYNNKWPDYPILRVSDNTLNELKHCVLSDNELSLLGYILTDGSFSKPYYGIHLYQSINREKNSMIYQKMKDTCDALDIQYTERLVSTGQYSLYLRKTKFLYWIWSTFTNRVLTWDFVSTLNQDQADTLMWSMIEGDGTLGNNHQNITMCCGTKQQSDIFQYLAFVAGYATNCYEVKPGTHNSYPSSNKCYTSVNNEECIHITKPYYQVTVLRVKRAHIYPHHKSKTNCNGVWCVTTKNGTWVARRHGKVYITGNSIIQGSAADQSKMAILLIENNKRWKEIGGRILTPIHDEILAEVPMEYYEEGAQLLSSLMCKAADFLPFESKCDVEITTRWYGLEFPCPYKKASSINTVELDEVKWIQYHLIEMEYTLPVRPDETGQTLGNASRGVSGQRTEEMEEAIFDYMTRFHVSESEFIDHIEQKVKYGN